MVSFNPTSVESKTVNLQVTSNDPDGFLLKGQNNAVIAAINGQGALRTASPEDIPTLSGLGFLLMVGSTHSRSSTSTASEVVGFPLRMNPTPLTQKINRQPEIDLKRD